MSEAKPARTGEWYACECGAKVWLDAIRVHLALIHGRNHHTVTGQD